MKTLESLLPLLNWIIGGGAGLLASLTFDRIRAACSAEGTPAWIYQPLYTARYARYINIVLAIVFGVAAASVAALIRGEPVGNAADSMLASMIGSLYLHARTSLPTEPLLINSAPGADVSFDEADDAE